MPPRVSRKRISGTGSLRRLPPRVQKADRDAHPTPAFCEKSLQAIENKRWECAKERKERKRVRNRLKTKGHLGGRLIRDRRVADTHGVAVEGRDETGHCQRNLGLEITASVT